MTVEKKMIQLNEEESLIDEVSLHEDILSEIFSYVPLVDLVSAFNVSLSWKSAVSSSLCHRNTVKPWLIIHTQSTTSPYLTISRAYDPRSAVWVDIRQPPIKHVSILRSSHSTLLYMLSSSRLSFCSDALNLTWHHAHAPLVWRPDPIVAMVNRQVIVAGGTCDFVDDPLAVEIYNLDSGTWDSCDFMPAVFRDYAASTWLSVVVDDQRMYVMQRSSGLMYSFDPKVKTWCGPNNLCPESGLFSSDLGFVANHLILIGLVGTAENVKSVKMWEMKIEAESTSSKLIGEMPTAMVEKLRGESPCLPSISITSSENFAYIHSSSGTGEIILCEVVQGGIRWSNIENLGTETQNPMERLVFTSAKVGIEDLQTALKLGNRRFAVKNSGFRR